MEQQMMKMERNFDRNIFGTKIWIFSEFKYFLKSRFITDSIPLKISVSIVLLPMCKFKFWQIFLNCLSYFTIFLLGFSGSYSSSVKEVNIWCKFSVLNSIFWFSGKWFPKSMQAILSGSNRETIVISTKVYLINSSFEIRVEIK